MKREGPGDEAKPHIAKQQREVAERTSLIDCRLTERSGNTKVMVGRFVSLLRFTPSIYQVLTQQVSNRLRLPIKL